MTKTYELPNEKMLMADVDEKHHTATVSVYALDGLVEAVNKTGHWIDHQEDRWVYAECSECGTVHDTQTNYCPSCGANSYSVLRLNHDGDWECIYPHTVYMQSFVIAWMPLPEPYKAEGGGEE